MALYHTHAVYLKIAFYHASSEQLPASFVACFNDLMLAGRSLWITIRGTTHTLLKWAGQWLLRKEKPGTTTESLTSNMSSWSLVVSLGNALMNLLSIQMSWPWKHLSSLRICQKLVYWRVDFPASN